jgi:nucleoside-triphosphatase THEP1
MENYGQAILLTGKRGVGKTTVCQAVAELTRRRGYRPGGVITPALYACPAGWELGIGNLGFDKVGFEAVDVGSGERWPLARTGPSTGSGRGPSRTLRSTSETPPTGHRREPGGPRVGPYSFAPAALARALRVLRKAATLRQACPERNRRAEDTAAGCDLLIVDEIGPLELEQGKGFAPILDLVHWRSSRTCSAPAKRETSPVLSTVEGFATPEENSEDSLSGERPMHTLIVVRPAFVDRLLLHLRDTDFTVFSVTEENRDELPLRIVEELWGDGCLS